ncbi:MAG: aminopeptidase P family protein, partial [bacterium]
MLRILLISLTFFVIFLCGVIVAATGTDNPVIDHAVIQRERINQLLPQIMQEQNVDMWLIFTRENSEDPILPTIGIKHIVARG